MPLTADGSRQVRCPARPSGDSVPSMPASLCVSRDASRVTITGVVALARILPPAGEMLATARLATVQAMVGALPSATVG